MDEFEYVIGEKEDVVIILFQGRIGGREAPSFETLAEELKGKSQTNLIFDFRNVSHILPATNAMFAKFLRSLRDANKVVAFSSLKPDFKNIMIAGIIKKSEIFNNIPDAWKKLSSKS